MGLKNSQYHAIMRKYEQKQLHSHDIQMARYEEVYKKLPEFKTLDDSIASLSIQHGKKLLDGDTSAVDALKKDLAELRNRKIHLLKSAGFPEDYLEPVYDCPDCKDTGYILMAVSMMIVVAIVSKKRSLDCFMTSQILKNSL